MKIFLGADHRGFSLKEEIKTWLESEDFDVVDCGNTKHDPEDNYPDFGQAVARSMNEYEGDSFGIVICGSGVGISIAANRHKGVYCALAFSSKQVEHARRNDHINAIAIPSDFIDFEKAKRLVKALTETTPDMKEKYVNRTIALDT